MLGALVNYILYDSLYNPWSTAGRECRGVLDNIHCWFQASGIIGLLSNKIPPSMAKIAKWFYNKEMNYKLIE